MLPGQDANPDVSVVIPCHGAVATLPLQLEALSKQVRAPHFEVLLADNGMNDGLDSIVREWQGRVPGLRIVDATAKPGTGFARNRGAAAALGNKLLFCDADDVAFPDWVLRGSRTLDEIEMFSGAAVPIPESVFAQGYEAALAAAGPNPSAAPEYVLSGTAAYPILMGATFGYRKPVFLRLGGFDAAFGALAEDNDLAFRTQAAGVPVLNAGVVRLAYRVRGEDDSAIRRAFRGGVAHARLCATHRAWSRSPSYYPRLWQEPFRALAAAVRGVVRPSPCPVRWRGRLGTSLGLLVGRLRFAFCRPVTRVGEGLDTHDD